MIILFMLMVSSTFCWGMNSTTSELREKFRKAIWSVDLPGVKEYVAAGGDVNIPIDGEHGALHRTHALPWMREHDDLTQQKIQELSAYLINETHYNINRKCSDGCTFLFDFLKDLPIYAPSIMEQLIQKGVNIHDKNNEGKNIFHALAGMGKRDSTCDHPDLPHIIAQVCAILFNQKLEICFDNNGNSPFHELVHWRKTSPLLLKQLLSYAGSEVDDILSKRNKKGLTAYEYAEQQLPEQQKLGALYFSVDIPRYQEIADIFKAHFKSRYYFLKHIIKEMRQDEKQNYFKSMPSDLDHALITYIIQHPGI